MYKLLVIEDEHYALEGIMKTLDWKDLGIIDVFGADCIKDAKSIIQNQMPEIIVCDIEMPEENGLDLLRWLSHSRYHYRFLFLTAHPNFQYAQEAIQLGVFEYLLKPVDYTLLKETVQNALDSYKKESLIQNQLEEYESFLRAYETIEYEEENIKRLRSLEANEPELIHSVKDYITTHMGIELTREMIADIVGVNDSYLSRVFHKVTHRKLSDYILEKKIALAKELLRDTDDKITFVAHQVGYGSESYFIKIFKKVTNMTPYEYRKKVRNEI